LWNPVIFATIVASKKAAEIKHPLRSLRHQQDRYLPMTRKAWFTTFFLIPVFFLITLGMRNPFLDHNPGPKPRPRAIIEENVSKSQFADSDASKLHVDADVCRAVTIAARIAVPDSLVSQLSSHRPDHVVSSLPSRASPLISLA
jgi:hypothetical protein